MGYGVRLFTHLTCSLGIVTLRSMHKSCTYARKLMHTKPVEWFGTLIGLPLGGTFNCLVIVSMLSVSQSIKPH